MTIRDTAIVRVTLGLVLMIGLQLGWFYIFDCKSGTALGLGSGLGQENVRVQVMNYKGRCNRGEGIEVGRLGVHRGTAAKGLGRDDQVIPRRRERGVRKGKGRGQR